MERKATAFVEQFSATLFTQWAQQGADQKLFWRDLKFLQNVLEEGVAKLPKVPLKGHLTRELSRYVELLQTTLQRQYAEHAQTQKQAADERPRLLNEEDVERALATAVDADQEAHLASVLALDDAVASRLEESVKQAKRTAEFVTLAEQCAQQLRVVRARAYEAADQTDRKSALFMQLIVQCVDAAARVWCEDSRGKWACDASSKLCKEREALRVVLEAVVTADLLKPTATHQPWTSFFRPEESAVFRSVAVAKARAGVYGALLSLAVAFPVVYDDEDDSDDETSKKSSSTSGDSSSSDDDSEPTKRRKRSSKKQRVDCVLLAKHVARQVILAAKSGEVSSINWYLDVLVAFHNLAKPTKYIFDDDDEDEEDGLTNEQRKALYDALAEVYARAFATSGELWTQRQREPMSLLEALLCLRHAAEFMRVERKQTVPAITTATTQLVGVALPSVFWKWMMHIKKVYAGEHPVMQSVMKKLTKQKAEKKMANVLMHDSVVTLSELRVLVEQFGLFLETEKERSHFVVARAPSKEDENDNAASTEDGGLFFVDNAGGKNKKRANSEKDKTSEPTENEASRKRGKQTH